MLSASDLTFGGQSSLLGLLKHLLLVDSISHYRVQLAGSGGWLLQVSSIFTFLAEIELLEHHPWQ